MPDDHYRPDPRPSPHPLVYLQPSDSQREVMIEIRDQFINLYDYVVAVLPHSRYRSLVLTELESANMWANKCVLFDTETAMGGSE